MSIQHFAAAPGQIISLLLSCCVKSPAARSTLLIAGEEEPLLPSEAEREGGRRRRRGRGAVVHSPSFPATCLHCVAGRSVSHLGASRERDVWRSSCAGISGSSLCSRRAGTSQSEVNDVMILSKLMVMRVVLISIRFCQSPGRTSS